MVLLVQAWNAGAGVFSVAANWKSKTVPENNDVVVLSGAVGATVTNTKT